MDYSRVFGSNFPSSLITVGTKKDVDDSVLTLVNQYQKYMESGNRSSANNLYINNKEILEPYKISMKDFNSLQEELYNLGLYSLQQSSIISASSEPADMSDGSIWIELGEVVI